MNQSNESSPRFAGLDGLRGWAVIAVVAFHAGLLDAGWIGVDVFMALSGFLITGVIIRDLDAKDPSILRRFWVRRARRLVPALLLVIAIVSVVTLFEPEGWTIPTSREVWGALTYTSNWLRLGESTSYWQMFDAPSAFDHLWSLAIEEQFYVVWPIVMIVAWKWRGHRGAMVVAGLGFILTATAQIVLAQKGVEIERIYVGTDTRAPAFLAGAMVNIGIARITSIASRARVTLGVVTASFILCASVAFDGDSRATYSGLLLAVSVSGAVLVGVLSTFDGSLFGMRLVEIGPLRMLGRWSYGLYLIHWPVIILLGVDRWNSPVRFMLAMAISTGFAALSYEFFERPILERRFLRLAFPVLSVAVVTLAIISTATSREVPPEVSDAEVRELTTPIPVPPDPGAVRVLVVGDSVVFGMKDELMSLGRERGARVAVRAAPGCTTSQSRDDQNNLFSLDLCVSIRLGLKADVRRLSPDRVILFYGGTWDPFVWEGERYDPCSPDGQSLMRESLDRLLVDLGPSAHVEIVIPPQMGGDYGKEAVGAAACYRNMYLATKNVDFIRLDQFVCPAEAVTCPDEFYGSRLRYDGLHYSPEGIAVVAPIILAGEPGSQ